MISADLVMDVEVPDHEKKIISVHRFEDRSIGTTLFNPWQLGIPDMIMHSLSAFPYYRVMSREYILNQVLEEQRFQLLGLTDDTSAIELGKLLNAEYVVIGSFTVFQDTLQVAAMCLSVQSGELVGSASANGSLADFFEIQTSLAVDIAKHMNLYVSTDVQEKLTARKETKVVEASLANYEGEEKLEEMALLEKQGSPEDLSRFREEAVEDFKRALSYDKGYERAKRNLSRLTLSIPMTL